MATMLLACSSPASNSGSARWQEFRTWVHSEWVVDLANDVQAWNDTGVDGTPAQVLAAADTLIADVRPALAWLDSHPAEQCYANAHRLLRLYLSELSASLVAMKSAYATQSQPALIASVNRMAAALKTRDQSGTAYDAVRC